MGTRCLTVLKGNDGDEIAVLYRQMDGYPAGGHGQDLADFLKTAEYNGMDCLAAQVVAHFKDGPYDFYLYPAGTRDCGEEWVYTVYKDESGLKIKVQGGCVTFFGLPGTKQDNMPVVFDGSPSDFDAEAIEQKYNELMDKAEIPNDYLASKGLQP